MKSSWIHRYGLFRIGHNVGNIYSLFMEVNIASKGRTIEKNNMGINKMLTKTPGIKVRLKKFPASEQEQILTDYIRQEVSMSLGIDKISLDVDQVLFGVDSFLFLNLVDRISKELEIEIVPTELVVFLSQFKIRALAQYFNKKIDDKEIEN